MYKVNDRLGTKQVYRAPGCRGRMQSVDENGAALRRGPAIKIIRSPGGHPWSQQRRTSISSKSLKTKPHVCGSTAFVPPPLRAAGTRQAVLRSLRLFLFS